MAVVRQLILSMPADPRDALKNACAPNHYPVTSLNRPKLDTAQMHFVV